MSRLVLLAAVAATALTLAGCGKKPGYVDPPQGVENDKFPRPYPNSKTDPKPGNAASGQSSSGVRFP
ncbi:hypothetical protein [Azospirillum sp. sgz302134]